MHKRVLPGILPLIAAAAALFQALPAPADVRLPMFFSDHMVLQRGKPVPFWGWADPGERVTVEFAGRKKTVVARADGTWKLSLGELKASAEPRVLTIEANNTRELQNVLVGEVWICSGQSNMAWTVAKAANADDEIAAADHPGIRMFLTDLETAARPKEDCSGKWVVCGPETAGAFSAVGYYFGRELHGELDVPVGLIRTAWGGTRSEAWTSMEALRAEPQARKLLADWAQRQTAFDAGVAQKRFEKEIAQWTEQMQSLRERIKTLPEGTPRPRAPRRPQLPADPRLDRHNCAAIYNAMIAPFAGFAIRGAIWYQGESNQDRAVQYRSIFPAMIRDWQSRWGEDFSFYFVQLANFRAVNDDAGTTDPWAELQEAQRMTLDAVPGAGMAVINDIGEADNIHPKNKQDVGRRLALWALAKDYGRKNLVHSGPLYKAMKVKGDEVILEFDHVGSGLAVAGDDAKLQRFEIAGADRKFVWADAQITPENAIVVSSPEVMAPVAVRYAWASNPAGANLVNKEGLPAPLFRTDDWPVSTEGVFSPFVDEEKE